MANCPVCNTEYNEGTVEVCSQCGWDLTPYLMFLGQIPNHLLENERKKLTWAKKAWIRSQSKEELDRANQKIVSLQAQLKNTQEAHKLSKEQTSCMNSQKMRKVGNKSDRE